MKTLSLLTLAFLNLHLSLATGNNNGLPEEHLVFAHSKYHLKEFTFISSKHSLGLVNEPFQNQTLVVLYNDHNLVIDSLYADWEIENVIPENDSVFYLQNRNETVKCLIRDGQLYINGQFSGTVSDPQYEKIAFYTIPLSSGDFNVVKDACRKKSYAIRVSKNESDNKADYFPFATCKKKMNFDLDASREELFLFLNDDQKILKLNKGSLGIEEINLNSYDKNIKWHFYYDYVKDHSYLVSESKNHNSLFILETSNELKHLKDLDFIPEAVFNGFLHKKSNEGKYYSHYLIPIELKEKEKSILLKDVEISSD